MVRAVVFLQRRSRARLPALRGQDHWRRIHRRFHSTASSTDHRPGRRVEEGGSPLEVVFEPPVLLRPVLPIQACDVFPFSGVHVSIITCLPGNARCQREVAIWQGSGKKRERFARWLPERGRHAVVAKQAVMARVCRGRHYSGQGGFKCKVPASGAARLLGDLGRREEC
jgi:hypothetical protein